ncbi:DUF6745 domain-containing protein [Tenggerimyces flavus]|uniref:DUF6745 domain-containing protein n=1 Tax=Tenggerimyces flavus TaxID=1708749 RepID=A0ABV7YP89_9ACTN|nr:hypothetical protein [Tenggerimyces flavus]MBM7784500.1 hypothetical protein [Tenggerimyces flavus]
MAQPPERLTKQQLGQAAATTARWSRVAICTDEADFPEFERGAQALYAANDLPWPDRVVRVSSPIVGALAAPIADWLLTRRRGALRRRGAPLVDRLVRRTLRRSRVDDNARQAVTDAVMRAVGLPVPSREPKAAPVRVDPVVNEFQDALSLAAGTSLGIGALVGCVGAFVLARFQFDLSTGWAVVLGLVAGTVIGGLAALVLSGLVNGIIAAYRGEPTFETSTLRGARPWTAGDQVDATIVRPLEALGEAINGAVSEAVDAAVAGAVRFGWIDRAFPAPRPMVGQWDVAQLARAEFVGTLGAAEALTSTVGWWWPHRSFVLVTDRPGLLHLDPDDSLRPHCEDDPAIVWRDGWSLWFVHGVRVTQQIVEAPGTLRVDRITYEENAEVRRVMIDRYGTEKYLRAAEGKLVQQDDFGELWQLRHGAEPLQFVKVVNSTPEPDGTFRDYWLRVPPEVTTAHEAVAWTFGFTPEEYRPQRQT